MIISSEPIVKVILAYIDLGTGAYMIQMLLAVGFGALASLFIWRQRFASFVKIILNKLRGKDEPSKRSEKH